MIAAHLRERFFQRYGFELTANSLAQLTALAKDSPTRELDAFLPARERVWVNWRGVTIGLVWSKRSRYVITFLPPHARIGQKPPKTGGPRQ